jgi:hypothetical protein
MRLVLFCLLLGGCSSTSVMVPDHERNTSQYNLLDSPDGMNDPNARIKIINIKY